MRVNLRAAIEQNRHALGRAIKDYCLDVMEVALDDLPHYLHFSLAKC